MSIENPLLHLRDPRGYWLRLDAERNSGTIRPKRMTDSASSAAPTSGTAEGLRDLARLIAAVRTER